MSKLEAFKVIYSQAIKADSDFDHDMSYLELGGNSVGIFLLTETAKKELSIVIDPTVLLEGDSSFNGLVKKYIQG